MIKKGIEGVDLEIEDDIATFSFMLYDKNGVNVVECCIWEGDVDEFDSLLDSLPKKVNIKTLPKYIEKWEEKNWGEFEEFLVNGRKDDV